MNSLSTANRASAAITGIALLLVVSVTLASVVAVGSDQLQVIPSSYACQDTTASTGGRTDNSVSSSLPAHQASNVALSLTVSETMIALTHEAGPSLRLAMVDMHISVNQEPLLHQPPIPFLLRRASAADRMDHSTAQAMAYGQLASKGQSESLEQIVLNRCRVDSLI